jgi:hypothetical protein
MFDHLLHPGASTEQVDDADPVEFRARLWDAPPIDEPEDEDRIPFDPSTVADGPVDSDAVWAERERIAHALWEQEYLTTDGALARLARYSADEARCVGSKLRAIDDFVAAREREVALAVAEETRDGGSRDEIEATINAARESAEAELGLSMRLSAGAASEWVDFATGLARRLPVTLKSLEAGRIPERFARILLKETANLTATQAAWVERQALANAHKFTASAFRRMVRRRVEKVDADAVLKRQAAARAERNVTLTSAGDGMAYLTAYVPAEEGAAMFGVIDTFAHQRASGDDRTVGQRRADAMVDLITRPGTQDPRVGFVVHLHAQTCERCAASDDGAAGDDEHMAAHHERPAADSANPANPADPDDPTTPVTGSAATAQVQGGESIPAQRAREIADLTVHHPSVPVDIAAILADYNSRPDVYKPSAKLKRAVRLRDKHCRFPGCRRPAHRCELDHTIAFEIGGRTIYANLSALCKHHHRIKHMPGWRCTQDEAGVLTWTTPSGQTYITRPPPAVGDEPPDFDSPPVPAAGPGPVDGCDDVPPY